MAKREMVQAHVDNLLKRITGNNELKRDADGDWPFVLHRAVMYVTVAGDVDPTVRVVALAARQVPAGEQLFRMLNDANAQIQFSRALWRDGTMFVVTELVGESLDIEELDTAMKRVAAGADFFGPQVVDACGGETPRPAPKPAEPAPEKVSQAPGMYL